MVGAGAGAAVDVAMLTDLRVRQPGEILRRWAARRRRSLIEADGRLLIVACDHPARGALGVRDDPMAMASRAETLQRMVAALSRPGVDGVLGTADVLDDLLLLGALEGKLAIGSMNRGGLQGASWELEDRFTGYSAAAIQAAGLDGGKMLTRIDLADPGTSVTLHAAAHAINDLAATGSMAMVEPFWSTRRGDRVVNLLDPDSVIRSIHVAQGLGETSAHTWLKLPVVEDLERVMGATTLPTLLLGGDPVDDPDVTYQKWRNALEINPVRGLVVGRALLWPRDDDVAAAVDIASELVHGGAS